MLVQKFLLLLSIFLASKYLIYNNNYRENINIFYIENNTE